MRPVADVLIVGAGIVGAACALECVRAGLKTLVVESHIVGGGATGAGMGHLVVMDDSPAQIALTQLSCALWKDLQHELPQSVEYEPCGTMWVAADAEEMAEVERKSRVYAQAGVASEVVFGKTLYDYEPNLKPGLSGGLRVPGDAVIYPPTAASWLLDRAIVHGSKFQKRQMVREVQEGGVVVFENGDRLCARTVVVATGANATVLVPGIAMKPRKGHLIITDRYPGHIRHQLIELGYLKNAHKSTQDSVAFNVQPRRTGQLLIGSSRQYGAVDSRVEESITAKMLERALWYLPHLKDLLCLRVWTGFRAATPDKVPLIGPAPNPETGKPMEGVWLATGHEGLGITTSLGTARILTDRLVGNAPSIPWEPYDPSRFALKSEDIP